MSKTTSIRLRPEVRDTVKRLADSDDRTVSWMIDRLVCEALEARGIPVVLDGQPKPDR